MAAIKINTRVDKAAWDELQRLAVESHANISDLLTEAIREYLQRRPRRSSILRHLDDSIADNAELARLLAD